MSKDTAFNEKQLQAIQFFVATLNVCPLAIPKSCAQNMSIRLLENHSFPSSRIHFNPRTYFARPKTCYCQQQSSQYPIFQSQARDQSFTRVARSETKYQKILDAADFAKHAPLQDSVREYIREISVAMFLQIQSDMYIYFFLSLRAGGILEILESDWFRERADF